MKKVPLNAIGIALTVAGAALSVAQAFIGEKQQSAKIMEEVKKAVDQLNK